MGSLYLPMWSIVATDANGGTLFFQMSSDVWIVLFITL
jgi:hypothetical protein